MALVLVKQMRSYMFKAVLCMFFASAYVWPQKPSFNVPLDHPVYELLDKLALPGVANGVSLSNRPYTEHQVCELLKYAREHNTASGKKIIDFYLLEFSDSTASVKMADIRLDGARTHAYPYMTTDLRLQDSGFSRAGFNARTIDGISTATETGNKTAAGGRLYSNINGIISYFDGAIITEYGSRERWLKVNDPRTGQNYTTIMAEKGEPGTFIGYDAFSGYVKFPVKGLDLMAGFDHVSWGYAGSSGLLFSGEGRPFLQSRVSGSLGKIDYSFVLGSLTGDTYEQSRIIYAKHISYSPVKSFSIGLSDAIISTEDRLKMPYFLPFVPFYFVEHYIGGNDNRIMSFDVNWLVADIVSLYGELLIDETSNLLGIISNSSANDIWAGLCGVKWHNPIPQLPVSMLKFEIVQLEPWTYSRYTYIGKILPNNPVNFGSPIGNQMGPHSRSLSLELSGMFSEQIKGAMQVTQFQKGAGHGSDIYEGNDFTLDTLTGEDKQNFADKDYRFKSFAKNRTVITVSAAHTHKHWLQTRIFGDFVLEQRPVSESFLRIGTELKLNY